MARFHERARRVALGLGATAVGAVAVAAGTAALAGEASAGDPGVAGAVTARMHDAHGNEVGLVRFLPQPGGKVAVRATGSLPTGFHGFHVHAVGRCESPFTSAGGHHNPASTRHGAHAGDMPVLLAGDDGEAWAEFESATFTIEELLDADGSAVIVHAGADNYANVPTRYAASGPDATTLATGDAGGRIACGVVERH